MGSYKKPLNTYEQSLLLMAMLFDRQNLDGILSFFPDDQNQRMVRAREKFLSLPRDECMTQIVLELRRLLLIDEYSSDFIHPSWIDHAMGEEPSYLRPYLKKTICSSHAGGHSGISLSLLKNVFIGNILKTPQKIAIFDPVLMRLQSLKGESQKEKLKALGECAISCIKLMANNDRLARFMSRNKIADSAPTFGLEKINNPFSHKSVYRYFIRQLVAMPKKRNIEPEIWLALSVIGIYLIGQKPRWRRGVILSLRMNFGLLLNEIIEDIRPTEIDEQGYQDLSKLILFAFDRAK